MLLRQLDEEVIVAIPGMEAFTAVVVAIHDDMVMVEHYDADEDTLVAQIVDRGFITRMLIGL